MIFENFISECGDDVSPPYNEFVIKLMCCGKGINVRNVAGKKAMNEQRNSLFKQTGEKLC